MADKTQQDADLSRPANNPKNETFDGGRRSFLSTGVSAVMAAGLASGYGMFFAMAGRFFYPTGANRAWIFVSDAASIRPGESFPFKSPTGVSVVITRQSDESTEIGSDSFLALSSVCPHLGCRVHWESNNNRFFCPCHNGVFDASGKATGGPPAAAGQDLPHYALQVVEGALYIEMSISSIGKRA
ncbi:MAG: ubiquinol-cytochrome c reductase iron-sulfur subunit [Planctomycetes bacterium]|nr:ubiquinol-cytochrome c reductase iron-sulfur subunit [Planctomycetota bacterium]